MIRRAVIVDDEPLARERIRHLLIGHDDFAVVAECDRGEAAVAVAAAELPDVLFIDVQIPGLDGFAVAEALVDTIDAAQLPLLIFVTAHDRYALRAFDASAVDYLLKPIGRERFDRAIARARRHLALRERASDQPGPSEHSVTELVGQVHAVGRAERLAVRHGKTFRFLQAEDIDWIDAVGNYVRLHSAGTVYMLRSPISALAERLDPKRFLRIHRSAIVNLDSVTQLRSADHGEYVVTLADGARLKVSRTFSPRLRALVRDQS
jgi:two-component system, LytTR family, response regulator